MDHIAVSSVPFPRAGDVLLVVDVQKDFLHGGALPVTEGDAVIPVLNRGIALFRCLGLPICASRDWHCERHGSFREQGGPWPSHCVAGSAGAAFAPALRLPHFAHVVSKGLQATRPGYNAFESLRFQSLLARLGCRRLFVGGLATDYCVLHTVLAARRRGFDVVVLLDAIRAVEAHPGDGAAALSRMRRAGAVFTTESQIHSIRGDHAHGACKSVIDRSLPTGNAQKLPR